MFILFLFQIIQKKTYISLSYLNLELIIIVKQEISKYSIEIIFLLLYLFFYSKQISIYYKSLSYEQKSFSQNNIC